MMKRAFTCLAIFVLSACAQSDDTQETIEHTSEIVAVQGDQSITMAQVDAPLTLALYDLEWQKYQLRKASLNKILKDRGGDAKVTLEPPTPPRLDIVWGDRPIRGDTDAPIKLAVFCSFQSSHCARLQPVLETLQQAYRSRLAIGYYDFPQDHHRFGYSAARTARCAIDQNENWDFIDSLFAAYDDLTLRRYELIARQTGIRPMALKMCYSGNHFDDAIDADISYGKSLGFKSVPVVLINGLYVKGPRTVEAYMHYIDQELARLGVSTSDAPKDASLVGAEDAEAEEDETYVPQGLGYDRVRNPDASTPRQSELTLSRSWLTDQLRDDAALKDKFYKAEHKAGGFSVLKLSDISGNAFFETLGLRTNDVILKVNGEWVHEGQNGLWEELRFSDEVEIQLMRRGKPVTYRYRINP